MADDNNSRFSLDRLTGGIGSRGKALLNSDSEPRSQDDISRDLGGGGPMKPFTAQHADYDRTEAPKDAMREYWRKFETTPIVRAPISSFASQVTEPGYYIKAKDIDEDDLRELDNWLQNCATIEGEQDQDFRLLAKKSTIQREVRGTSLIEKAPDESDDSKIAGLKLINPETMEAVTRPGQSILLKPDDIEKYEDAPEAESGGAAAYLQDLSETDNMFGTPVRDADDDYKIGFTRDEIIKITRDADVGEIFGTSRIEAVSTRIDGIKQKLDDNDEAIASKAYPLWLFLFGTDDEPMPTDKINEFMNAHEMDNFHPGMKQGVRGDISVETISGEVAEISEYLQFDIDWIMSAMPMPKFALGAFSDTVGQIGGVAQQQDVNRQINEARRELEEKFTPVLREIAQQQTDISEDEAKDIYLKIGSPNEPETEVPQRENIIRYVPEGERDDGGSGGNDGQTIKDSEFDDGNQSIGVDGEDEEDVPDNEGAQVWHEDTGLAELELMAGDNREQLADVIYDTMVRTRESTLDKVENEYGSTPIFAATNFERIANREMGRQMSESGLRDDCKEIVSDTIDSLQESLDTSHSGFSKRQNVRFYLQDIESSTENAIEEMLRLMRLQIRRAVTNNDEWRTVRSRTVDRYNNANLRQRAELIAHMELKNIEETTKLQSWENNPNIVGVRAVNRTSDTPISTSLNGAEAYFDDGSLCDQWMDQTREQFLQKGFDPLPPTPPFHFNDTTTLEPIYED